MEAEHTFWANPTLWVAVAFGIFFAIVFYLGVHKKVATMLDERADEIRSQLDDARKLKEDAQSVLAKFQRKHRDAKKTADDIKKQALEEAKAFSIEARAQMDESLKRQAVALEDKISQAEAAAVKEIESVAVDLAVGAAERVLRDKLDAKTRAELQSAAISELPKTLNS